MSRSHALVAFLLCVVGCANQPSAAPDGPPVLTAWNNDHIGDNRWWKNEPQGLSVKWVSGLGTCSDVASCDPQKQLSLRVDAVRCRGCTVVDDPSGGESYDGIDFHVIPTDDWATVEVDVTDLASGAKATASQTAEVDHEVGFDLRCRVVDRQAVLNSVASHTQIDLWSGQHSFKDCGTSRTSGQAVAIFPEVVTYLGDTVFPFKSDTTTYDSDTHARFLSTLQTSTAPDGWDEAGNLETFNFAYYLHAEHVDHVEMTTQLADGTTVSSSVAIPPVCDQPSCAGRATGTRALGR